MRFGRRNLLMMMLGAAASGTGVAAGRQGGGMYGLIGKMIAAPGRRDALIEILLEGSASMPGCLSYIVAADPADANAIWITEVWDSKASHEASLTLPSVKEAIARGRPLIASFAESIATAPVGGHGLVRGRG